MVIQMINIWMVTFFIIYAIFFFVLGWITRDSKVPIKLVKRLNVNNYEDL
jgi:hypothetical protein